METSVVEKMKVIELKEKLAVRGLATSGLKAELISRLLTELNKTKKNDELDENDEECEDADNEERDEDEIESETEIEELFELQQNDIVNSVDAIVKKIGKRGKNTDFDYINKYDNADLARQAIEAENVWKKGNKSETTKGIKQA